MQMRLSSTLTWVIAQCHSKLHFSYQINSNSQIELENRRDLNFRAKNQSLNQIFTPKLTNLPNYGFEFSRQKSVISLKCSNWKCSKALNFCAKNQSFYKCFQTGNIVKLWIFVPKIRYWIKYSNWKSWQNFRAKTFM